MHSQSVYIYIFIAVLCMSVCIITLCIHFSSAQCSMLTISRRVLNINTDNLTYCSAYTNEIQPCTLYTNRNTTYSVANECCTICTRNIDHATCRVHCTRTDTIYTAHTTIIYMQSLSTPCISGLNYTTYLSSPCLIFIYGSIYIYMY